MGKYIDHGKVVITKGGRAFRVFHTWNALYQYMMHDANKHAHCAIVTVEGHKYSIEVYDNDVVSP